MKKNLIYKLVLLVIFVFIAVIPSHALENSINKLSFINIEKTDSNNYKLNLVFKQKYNGNAFIQRKGQDSYYIYLPETALKTSKTKILYKNGKDKKNINISVEEKPFITDTKQSKYVRLTVNTAEDYSLKIVSNTEKEVKQTGFIPFVIGLFKFVITAVILICVLYLASEFIKNLNRVNSSNNYISYKRRKPDEIEQFEKEIEQGNRTTVQNTTLPDFNIKKTLQSFADESFTCFDIQGNTENKNNYYEFKRSLNNNSVLLSDAKLKSKFKLTNPIKEAPLLQMPAAEDVIDIGDTKEIKEKPELISVLNITPRIGFYLTNVGETLALFGFVKDNVFLFKKFSDLSQINLQARFYDKHGENDLYIVKLDSYKAMIEISADAMKELAVL